MHQTETFVWKPHNSFIKPLTDTERGKTLLHSVHSLRTRGEAARPPGEPPPAAPTQHCRPRAGTRHPLFPLLPVSFPHLRPSRHPLVRGAEPQHRSPPGAGAAASPLTPAGAARRHFGRSAPRPRPSPALPCCRDPPRTRAPTWPDPLRPPHRLPRSQPRTSSPHTRGRRQGRLGARPAPVRERLQRAGAAGGREG